MIEFTGATHQIGERVILGLPEEASRQLPSRGQVAAQIEVAGTSFDGIVEPDGRRGHWLDLTGLGLEVGAEVGVRLLPLDAWPEPQLPPDFGAALQTASDIGGLWDDITPRARWEWVRWINATRNPKTRDRRIHVSIDKMRNGLRRPCCFDLSSCTDPELSRSGKLIQTP